MTQSRRKHNREGTISLLLALVMMMLAMAAVATTTRTQIRLRQSQMQQTSIARMDAAITVIAGSAIDVSSPLRLPIDPASDHWIEIQAIDPPAEPVAQPITDNSNPTWLRATEVRGKRVLRSINRRINKATP